MRKRLIAWLAAGAILMALVVGLTLALTPQEMNPAFAAATDFMNAAGTGDDATAFGLLSEPMQTWVRENCPAGSVSACVEGYIPDEWGGLLKAVFRRAAPDGEAWNVDLIATYEKEWGFSGVCIYHRMEKATDGSYRVAGWAGFIWCGDGRSRNMATNPETPNRAP